MKTQRKGKTQQHLLKSRDYLIQQSIREAGKVSCSSAWLRLLLLRLCVHSLLLTYFLTQCRYYCLLLPSGSETCSSVRVKGIACSEQDDVNAAAEPVIHAVVVGEEKVANDCQ
jgi:hypothetical protein